MSSPEVFVAVRELLTAELTDVPIVFPNEGDQPDSSMPWVYCEVAGTLSRRIELGNAAMEERGIVWCHVYCPVGVGTLESRIICKRLSNIFRSARDSPVTFGDQRLGDGAQGDDDGMLWLVSFSVDYSYQDR